MQKYLIFEPVSFFMAGFQNLYLILDYFCWQFGSYCYFASL